MASLFKKILIANRGEIAVRVIRACRELGISSVAVFSDVDRAALHVMKADEAYHIGPAAARESYLNIDRILETAKRAGADAIHPGYGFLSENAQFARACADAGIKFIGPPASAMEALGSKTSARQAADRAGVPRVPGSVQALESVEQAKEVATRVGYPIMLKAAAGGGGKGMRRVDTHADLESALAAAQSEALRAFANGDVYIEKLVVEPRHIEIQVLGDEHGNVVYLGERECSLQRRHQKVIEEAPSAIVDPEMRARMGETAVALALAAGYYNAGTLEFLVDKEKKFYFLEMNTRLQVEHPVTELVTGLDLVHLQILIAAGAPLPFAQSDLQLRGHAMEVRVYAEDPANNFFPSPGKITRLMTPSGPGIREDSGIYEGWTVPLDYDPMLSKLIAYAPTRDQAIRRLRRALDEYFIGGIANNLDLFRQILDDPEFVAARIHTGYLDRVLTAVPANSLQNGNHEKIAAIAAALREAGNNGPHKNGTSGNHSSSSADQKWKSVARQEALRTQ
ncbi:MAG: acetyl-CoA carboxylase biotin carboxylase subunit [Acidobacteria bacterium]|nr:acetyl-CoA carboxylase biotin carboxylase subunit [Acidobacteriota bacterium]MBV9146873.1 acetyl-CoA carboxylase biotin carboxylase subunit [Acidobacteriota bacterium]MBV9436294.1 acetyl-CoA carboxylase biotin carboxylase subunit [Acidobacteriota bacterium]